MARTVYLNRHRFGMGRAPLFIALDLMMSEGAISSSVPPADFTPLNISGCKWWLRADDVVTSGSTVVTINDRSGVGHVLNAVSGTMATYVASSAAFNSKPSIRFNRTQFYQKTGSINLPFANSPMTVFSVAFQRLQPDAVGANGIMTYGPNLSTLHLYQRLQGDGTYRVFTEGGTLTTTASLSTAGTASIWGFTFSPGNLSLYKNGSFLQSSSFTMFLTSSSPFMNVGTSDVTGAASTSRMDGDIAEIILYDTALSIANRQQVESYLKQRYGIP